YLRKIGVDSPITQLIGMSERISGDLAANTHVVQLRRPGSQTRFNISKALAIRQLRKSHRQKMIPARETVHFVITVVSLNTHTELVTRNKVHQLGEDRLANVHRSLLCQTWQRHGSDQDQIEKSWILT